MWSDADGAKGQVQADQGASSEVKLQGALPRSKQGQAAEQQTVSPERLKGGPQKGVHRLQELHNRVPP